MEIGGAQTPFSLQEGRTNETLGKAKVIGLATSIADFQRVGVPMDLITGMVPELLIRYRKVNAAGRVTCDMAA